METNLFSNILAGAAAGVMVVLVALLAFRSGAKVATQAVEAARRDPMFTTAIEYAGKNVDPAIVSSLLSIMALSKFAPIPEDGKAFVEALSKFVRTVTDGLPNDLPVEMQMAAHVSPVDLDKMAEKAADSAAEKLAAAVNKIPPKGL